jgi:hypothetical protein
VPGWIRLGRNVERSTDDDQLRQEIVQCYGRAARQLSRRFRRRAAWETAEEWLASAETALSLHETQPLRTLTQLYTRAVYNPQELDASTRDRARQALHQISWRKSAD